ncbi:MAG: radical SAM/SPASM domain-containing protein, partial [Candidatus Zixiibacteriota bacterium]
VYCPHTIFRDVWVSRHMTLTTFEKLLPAIKQAHLVHLQGWGEPLLNPYLFDMIAMAKQAGAHVGITTNGMLLGGEIIHRLVSSGLDIVAISLAGSAILNDRLREGTKYDDVLKGIQALEREKKRLDSSQPAVHIAYLLLRSAMDDLRRLPTDLEGIGVDQIVVSTLDFAIAPELRDEGVVPRDSSEFSGWLGQLEEVKSDATMRGMELHYYLVSPSPRRHGCVENAARSLFVSADGTVSPCVFTNLPVEPVPTASPRSPMLYTRVTFGNVNSQPLAKIWSRPDYVLFRRSFQNGSLMSPCKNCYKMFINEG